MPCNILVSEEIALAKQKSTSSIIRIVFCGKAKNKWDGKMPGDGVMFEQKNVQEVK